MVRLLQIGTGNGHATLLLARSLPPDALVISMEADPRAAAAARRSFSDAGYGDRISVIVGEPARFLHKLRGPFDVIHVNLAGYAAPARARIGALLAPGGALIKQGQGRNDTIVVNDMTITEWLAQAKADAAQRGLPELIPMLEGLAQATERLRAADWNDDADKDPFDSSRFDEARLPQGRPDDDDQ